MSNTGSLIKNIVTQKKYKEKYHWTDYFSYFYLFLGVFLMFGPIIWLGLSSVKSLAGIQEYPPTCLLYTSPSPRDVEESRMPSSA